jgi:hypothetical protein
MTKQKSSKTRTYHDHDPLAHKIDELKYAEKNKIMPWTEKSIRETPRAYFTLPNPQSIHPAFKLFSAARAQFPLIGFLEPFWRSGQSRFYATVHDPGMGGCMVTSLAL